MKYSFNLYNVDNNEEVINYFNFSAIGFYTDKIEFDDPSLFKISKVLF